ncbi:MAG: translation initiation factor [Conexivisphaera sp.]
MSQEICPVCGLPKDLCVCGELEKEHSKIVVKLETKRYGKPMTVIEGLDGKELDVYDLSKQLKKKLACGGTVKNDAIMLQGDHRDKIKGILIELGFKEDSIEVY